MAKKSFKGAPEDNPALMFVGGESEPQKKPAEKKAVTTPRATTSKKGKIAYRNKEPRSRRLQLLMTESLYRKVKGEADRNNTSVNEVINVILEETIKEEK